MAESRLRAIEAELDWLERELGGPLPPETNHVDARSFWAGGVIGYLLLATVSQRVPGPFDWTGVDHAIRLFERIESLPLLLIF